MTQDHYATLGVLPAADDVVIRAAYLALMRRYHPDRNASPDAVDHARSVIAAFAVLGDPEKRMRYDWDRRRAAEAAAGLSPRPPRRITPRGMAITLIALLSLVTFGALRAHFARSDPSVAPIGAQQAAPTPARPRAPAPISAPDRTPAPLQVPDVSPPTVLATRAPPSPPTKIASAPRPATPSTRLPKADTGERLAASPKPPEPRKVAARVAPKPTPPKPAATPSKPNENIIALERNGTAFFNQSYRYGKGEKRSALTSSRNAFLARREACKSDSCLRDASLRHVQEMNSIMQGAQLTP